jgi:hypothetical protein
MASATFESGALTRRWYPLAYHEGQSGYGRCQTRFIIVPAGRRSGKTEVAKRRIIIRALCAHIPGPYFRPYDDPRFGVGAPTVAQVKSIWWKDLKAMIPPRFLYGKPNESTLEIRLVNGASIRLFGLDKPERAEGNPFDGFVMDEYGNMKPDTWEDHLRPTLADRLGWADFIGVPEGHNHYYDLWTTAKAHVIECQVAGVAPDWARFHWTAEELLPLYNGEKGQEEILAAKRDMDIISYRQEFLGSFENFSGRAYWAFEEKHQAALRYHPRRPLCLCLDFNVEPCVAAVIQEQPLPLPGNPEGTGVIGEVHIPRGGNVLSVCDKFIADFGRHEGRVYLYGDATGGARGAGKVLGSEWEIVKRKIRGHFGMKNVSYRVPKKNPRERDRVSSVNSRLQSVAGHRRLMVDPRKAPNVIKDLDGVVLLKGGSGELDKSNLKLSHLSDAVGYYVCTEFPTKKQYLPRRKRHTGKHLP